MMRKAEQEAKEHWSYLDKILYRAGYDEDEREEIRFHYITAFVHGWKHAVEAREEVSHE